MPGWIIAFGEVLAFDLPQGRGLGTTTLHRHNSHEGKFERQPAGAPWACHGEWNSSRVLEKPVSRKSLVHAAHIRQGPVQVHSWALLNDDVSPSATDYSLDLHLLGLGHGELIKGLLEIVEKGLPLWRRDHEM